MCSPLRLWRVLDKRPETGTHPASSGWRAVTLHLNANVETPHISPRATAFPRSEHYFPRRLAHLRQTGLRASGCS